MAAGHGHASSTGNFTQNTGLKQEEHYGMRQQKCLERNAGIRAGKCCECKEGCNKELHKEQEYQAGNGCQEPRKE